MEVLDSTLDISPPPSDLEGDISRQMLEAYVIENYRQENMSLGRIAALRELSIYETHAFLKEHSVPLNYDEEDLARYRRTVEMFLKK